MKDTVAYYNALKKWAKMSPDLFATVDLEGFAGEVRRDGRENESRRRAT